MTGGNDSSDELGRWLAERPWAQVLAGVASLLLGIGLLVGAGIPGWVRYGVGPVCVLGGLLSIVVPLLRRRK